MIQIWRGLLESVDDYAWNQQHNQKAVNKR